MVVSLYLSYNVDSINKGFQMRKEFMQQALDALLKPTSSAKIAEITKSIRVELVKPEGWQPIDTAPKDGTSYLVWAGGVGMAHWVERYQSGYPHNAPFSENLAAWKSIATHWMPLPKAPT